MPGQLHPEQVLAGRFTLRRRLRAGASSQLWTGHDTSADTPRLLRIYLAAALSERAVMDTIERNARQHREHRPLHPHAAAIEDVEEADEGLIVSIAAPEGELVSTWLTRQPPMPYREVIALTTPLIEALQHLHEVGGEHGRLDADHIIIAGETRLVLIPGDATTPARHDMLQLGGFIADLLTGGDPPDPQRSLNDMPERLSEGRTVPALIEQLVGDLQSSDAGRRPPSMSGVLHKLRQVEDVVSVEPVAGPQPLRVSVTAAPVEPAARAKEPTTRRSPRRAIGALIAFAAVVGAFITGAVLMRSPGPTPPPPEESTEPPTVVADQTEPAEEPAPNAAAGSRADEALGEYLVARRAADDIGAATWGGEAYEQAAALAATADEAFLEERYDDAARSYEEASAAFGSVAATSGEAHVRLMREGAEAIERFDAAAATAAFEAALLIVPDDQIARRDLTRAGTLDEVNRLLTSGREHEDDGRFSLAYVDFAAARQLDPHSTAAAEAERRTKDALADEQFRAMMASALEAYHRDDFEAARAGLLEAKRFRGAVPEIEEALTMVAEGERRHTIGQLKQHATDHEKLEEYQKAWQTYRQALKLDPNIEFAQEGRVRCERMIQAVQQTRHFLDNPALLEKRGTREQALVFSQELEKMPDKGPKLAKDSAELAEKVRLANTPLRVVLRSDGKTEVDVYRVGRYGAFQSKELQLLPGEYTVVGHRPGYKDVRRALRVKHGEGQMSLEIVCREAI